MSVNYFAKDQIKFLSKNQYVVNVSDKAITYSEEFKNIFVLKCEKGLLPREIFEEAGLPINILGCERVKSSSRRWRLQAKRDDGFSDTRKTNSGRPLKRTLNDEEKMKRLENKVAILEQENAYLKKIV